MRSAVPLAVAIAAFAFAASSAFAAGNVASINYRRLLQEAPQIKASNELLKREFAPQEKAIKQEREKFEALRKRHLDMGPGTNQLQLASVTERLKTERKKLGDMEQQYASGLALRRRELQVSFTDLADKEIEAYAKAHGFDLVLKSGVLYGDAATDITGRILVRLQADYQHKRTADAGGENKRP